MMGNLFRVGLYAGAGLICLAAFEAHPIDWAAPWTFVWLLAWPLGLIARFAVLALYAVAACCVIGAIIWIWEKLK